MRKVFIAGVTSLAFLAIASASQEKPVPKSQWCSTVAYLAGSIMSSRQNGVPLDDIIKAIDGSSDRLKEISQEMVIEAYESPRYSSENIKQREITEFKNKWQLQCIKS